jgi:nitroreductase
MTRTFAPTPVDTALLDDLLDTARWAPSAGFAQGAHLIMLTGPRVDDFWRVTGAEHWYAEGVRAAPVVVLALADPTAYTERYAAPDKAGHGLEDPAAWPVPYWLTDTAMAVQNLLLLLEAHGLGALWFGVFRNADVLLADLGVPGHLQLVGVAAIGFRAGDDRPSGSATHRPRRGRSEQIHHEHW